MKLIIKNILNCIVFLLLLSSVIPMLSYISKPAESTKLQINKYESEEKDSIDIAFIGSSATFRYYDYLSIWGNYGITSSAYYGFGLPFEFTIPMIEYMNQKQSPEIIVIDLRDILDVEELSKYNGIHATTISEKNYLNALNLLPYGVNRIKAVINNPYLDNNEKYMMYFDLMYNHEHFMSGIDRIMVSEEKFPKQKYKGNQTMLFKTEDLTKSHVKFDETLGEEYVLSKSTIERLDELFKYAQERELSLFFTITPYTNSRSPYDKEVRREVVSYVEEHGFPIEDFRDDIDLIGLDYATDFYDDSHVNVIGAEKYTNYAMEYILRAYPIETNHTINVINDWNTELDQWNVYKEEQLLKMEEEMRLEIEDGDAIDEE